MIITAEAPETTRPEVPPVPVRRFTVAEYHRLLEIGLLHSGDPYELLEGWIVRKMPRNPPHDSTLQACDVLIREILPTDWSVRVQMAITLVDGEPEPDLVLVRGNFRNYRDRHPGPADAALVVEVADSSLFLDRGVKARSYARAGIAPYWVVNLVDRRVEVYTEPTAEGPEPHYRRRQDFGPDDAVPVAIAGQEVGRVAVRELLPAPPDAVPPG